MKRNLLFFLIIILCFLFGLWLWWYPAKKPMTARPVSFQKLTGWQQADLKPSFETFLKSCQVFLKQNPEKSLGTQHLSLQAGDWQLVCQKAMQLKSKDNASLKHFFQNELTPVAFYKNLEPAEGLFTGYYSPLLQGSLKRSEKYSVPLYGMPSNLVKVDLGLFADDLKHRTIFGRVKNHKLLPFPTRKEINKGAIKETADVLLWVDDLIDRQFLEIQGSGIIELENEQRINIGYAAQNGAPYTSLAGILIEKGVMDKDNASMQAIRRYLNEHPEEKQKILHQNESFVFFKRLKESAAYGAQGIGLTAGYSLAVDRKWVPLGTPVWLDSTYPSKRSDNENKLQRLMIAQDTGGAIKGPVRGDVYWGAGKKAKYIAGHMKNPGHYWLLLPKQAVKRNLKNSTLF